MPEMRLGLDGVEAAMQALKKARDAYAVTRNTAELKGFTLKILDRALKLERQPKNRRGQQVEANEEYFVLSTLGLPVARPQAELNFGSDEERDEAYWKDQGYQAGIRGDAAKPPAECPTSLHQAWLNRRADGAEYSAWGKAEAGAKPDQVTTGASVTTIDSARAAKAAAKGKPDAADGESGSVDDKEDERTAGGRPKGALEKDPLLAPA